MNEVPKGREHSLGSRPGRRYSGREVTASIVRFYSLPWRSWRALREKIYYEFGSSPATEQGSDETTVPSDLLPQGWRFYALAGDILSWQLLRILNSDFIILKYELPPKKA